MAIGYVGGRTAGFVGSVSTAVTVALDSGLTGGSGSGVSAGDLVVVGVGFGGTGVGSPSVAITTPSGHTALTPQYATSATYDTAHGVSYKIMGGTPDASVTIPPSTNTAWGGSYVIHVFSGVDATTPMDVAAVYALASSVANPKPNPPAITPTTAGAWIVAIGHAATSSAPATFGSSDLSGFLSSYGDDSTDSEVGGGYYSSWTSGAFDPAAFTGGGGSASANQSWAATTLALRPASTGGYTLTADGGSFAITGGAAGLRVSRRISAASGSFAVTGTAASLRAGRKITASAGSFSITGTAATLKAARRLAADSGSFSITGSAATLSVGRRLVAEAGAFVLTGADALLRAARRLVAEAGAFLITGSDATLTWDQQSSANGLGCAHITWAAPSCAVTYSTPSVAVEAVSAVALVAWSGPSVSANHSGPSAVVTWEVC